MFKFLVENLKENVKKVCIFIKEYVDYQYIIIIHEVYTDKTLIMNTNDEVQQQNIHKFLSQKKSKSNI